MRATAFLFKLLVKRPALGLKVLGSLLLAAAVVIAIGLIVEELRFSVPLCIAAAAPPTLLSIGAYRRGMEALRSDDDVEIESTAEGRVRTRRPGGYRVLYAGVALCGVAGALWCGATCAVHPSMLARRVTRWSPATGYRYNLVGNPEDVATSSRTGLVLMGGGKDIDEAFRWMIGRSGGGDFLVIRSTGTDAYNDYIYDMTAPGGERPDSVATLIIPSRAAAHDPFVAATIRRAEALWIAGGDQATILDFWRETPVVDAIHDALARGVPFGGTSSGLAVLGEFAYTSEADGVDWPHLMSTHALRDPFGPRVTVRGDFLRLPLLAGAILEPHFMQESRLGRLAVFMARIADETAGGAREVRGLGIERKTALLVEPDGTARVIAWPDHSLASVYLLRLAAPAEVCAPGLPLTARRIELRRFVPGQVLDLRSWGGAQGAADRLSVEDGHLFLIPTGG